MAREKLKDWTGRIIGQTEQIGSRLWLYDWTGRIEGQGNILMMLLK